MLISTRFIKHDELTDLIKFDKLHLIDILQKIGYSDDQWAPELTIDELIKAYHRKDILVWILVDSSIAGYIWLEKRENCLFVSSTAIKQEFYGCGLSTYIINYTENLANKLNLKKSQLAVLPTNGRIINAYLKHGYEIISYNSDYFGSIHPGKFLCIMEKNLALPYVKKVSIDTIEVTCNNIDQLKTLIDLGYRGIGFVRKDEKNAFKSSILFKKFEN